MYPRDQNNLRLPSDLNGILAATFELNRISETLEQACSQIKQNIQKEGVRKSRFERSGIVQINKPTILCASSTQYAQFEFDQDVAAAQKAFPGQVTVEPNLNSEKLRKLLVENEFDIVHINARAELWSGELVLSDIDWEELKPITPEPDVVNSDTLLQLITSSKTHLVVFATWGAQTLAVKLARVTNVISMYDQWHNEKSLKNIIKWEKYFYASLSAGECLSKACEKANLISEAPMYLILKKDVMFAK
jgi:hypothetical protein